MVRLTSILVMLALLGLLVGCGSAAPSDTTGSQPSAGATTEVTSTASAAPSSVAAPTLEETTMPGADAPTTSGGKDQTQSLDLIAALTRSGGLQGRTQTLLVQQDGTLALLNGAPGSAVFKTGTASAAQLQALQALLASDDWQQLDDSYGRQVPDGFMYSVTGGGKQVTTYDGAQNPPALENVLGKLGELWQAAQTAP